MEWRPLVGDEPGHLVLAQVEPGSRPEADALDERERLNSLRAEVEKDGKPFFAISSATGEGVRELVTAIGTRLDELKAAERKAATVELVL